MIDEISTMDLGTYAGLDKDISHLLQIQSFTLESGDTLILYTDGITEAMNRQQREFGKEGIVNAALAEKDNGADAITSSVVKNCFKHLDGTTIHDDLSLLVIKKR
jgi:sigma-B regulation protein RsbU (phosphoserine phosphatase)